MAGLSAAATAGLVLMPKSLHAEPAPETTTVRLPRWIGSGYCWAARTSPESCCAPTALPMSATWKPIRPSTVRSGSPAARPISICNYPPNQIKSIDAGVPIKVLTGLHSGCLELMANDSIHSITDLRGKRVGVTVFSLSAHTWLILMAAYVGLDPVNDIEWVTSEEATPAELFVEGKIDAFLASPPMRRRSAPEKIGHTILNNAVDRPWSQYFCCMISARADYVDSYPVATKRVLRAILKAADLCVSDPQSVAQQLVDRAFLPVRLCAPDAARDPVRPVEGIRSGRLAAVLRPAHA